ncbi:MAG: PAS domain S-box protein [Phyllobacterium sp.]
MPEAEGERTIVNSEFQNDRLAEARLAAIVDSSFDAIISKDLDGIITSWNRAAEQYIGYSAEEIIGKSIRILIPADHQSEEDAILARLRRGEVIDSFETQRVTKNGNLISVSLTVSPIRDQTGKIVGASKIVRDITAAKEDERKIRVLLREVNHRVKNQYSVIQSIVRETAKRAESIEAFEMQINARISALSSSHDLLVSTGWSGAYLGTLVGDQLRAFGQDGLVHISGPLVNLVPNAVLNIGMAIHELATNSAKYGVFAFSQGKILVEWTIANDKGGEYLCLTWSETDHTQSEPQDEIKKRTGFGSVVLFRVTPSALNGASQFCLQDGNRVWTLKVPLDICTRDSEDELIGSPIPIVV